MIISLAETETIERCSVMSPAGLFLPLLVFALLFTHGDVARIPRSTLDETCGYQACPKADPTKLNIHLVAHSHDDVGWLKTVDQYYFGSRKTTQNAGVQYILDSAIEALQANPERKFIYVETYFLWKWWLHQNEKTRENVRMLINEGRLEIIGGGWCMNDEAVTHYHSIVDQFTWGFRRLNDTFGSCARPHIGWQIDPFGHSRGQAAIFAQLGFDGFFFGRLDYQDKENRLKEKAMEFIWQGSPSLGASANLFTVALYNNYSPPPGFCFDILCDDEPIIDDVNSPDYNVKEKIDTFLRFVNQQAKGYGTNNVILTMGEDFMYQQAEMYFMNMDKLIRYVKELYGVKVNIFYSTPSCYLKAVNEANLQWSTKSDDFFPYASDPHSYWTGYFTSRPAIKFFERMGNNVLQISKQLSVIANLKEYEEQLISFREAMGVMQHHDAVTGTEKQLVANDYARLLYKAMNQGATIISEAISKWDHSAGANALQLLPRNMYSCMQLNISSCSYTKDDKILLTIYNPLSQAAVTPIRIPVQDGGYVVEDSGSGLRVASQLVPIPHDVKRIPGRTSDATQEVVFIGEIPPLGYKFYVLKKVAEYEPPIATISDIGNEFFNVTVNTDGRIIVDLKREEQMHFVQEFSYYEGMTGNNEVFENRSSGAYIFRPKGVSTKRFEVPGYYKVYKGPVVEEIHQTVNDWVSQVIRVYRGKEYVEFDWLVGPIPVHDNIGKEIVTKYRSNLESDGEFYTDSNGREMLKRKRNHRPTWVLKLAEQVSGNYYPVTNKISLSDKKKNLKLSVLTDRAQGGTSMRDGEIELMLHRRLLKDDAFGVGEALNESAFGEGLAVRGSHYLIGGSTVNRDALAKKEKALTLQMALRPWITFTPMNNAESYIPMSARSGLAKLLPPNIQILTLEPWKDNTILLRLEHVFEVGESENLSAPVDLDIQGLFSTFTILSIEETTLGGNQWIKDLNRLKWQSETNDILQTTESNTPPVKIENNIIYVRLNPMEIRTFILKIAPRNV